PLGPPFVNGLFQGEGTIPTNWVNSRRGRVILRRAKSESGIALGCMLFSCSPSRATGDGDMIVTVTLNPAIDRSLTVPRFEVGKTNRGEVTQTDAGGKGINVAKAVKQFETKVCALGFVAGSNGHFILEALAASRIPADFINVPGETRVNLKILDPVYRTETELSQPGFQVLPEHLEAMKEKIREYGSRCDVMVFSG